MNPYLIGVVNVFLPGLGYIILQKRLVFGWLLLISTVSYIGANFYFPATDQFFFSTDPMGKFLEVVALVTGALAFGYDAYTLAKEPRI